MKSRMKKTKNGGFTLIEVLVVSAIMIILMAIGFTELARNSRTLKLTELDNMAREIYLAAEHRAVLLANSGRLEGLVKADDNAVKADKKYFVRSDAMPGDLLPTGLVEPALTDNCFYIVYDVKAGDVTDVFYAEAVTDTDKFANFTYAFGKYAAGGNAGFSALYQKATEAGGLSRAVRMEDGIKIGYYGGEADAPSLPTPDPSTPYTPNAPVITIKNGEELELTVAYDNNALSNSNGWELKVTLLYGTGRAELVTPPASPGGSYSGGAVSTKGFSEIRTWILDTLDSPTDNKKQFKDWFEGVADAPASFGGNFTVTASLEKDGVKIEAVPKSENSLFGSNSGDGNRAYITNLRHLQNLDSTFSNVAGKTEAHQMADIDAGVLMDNDGNHIKTDPTGGDVEANWKRWIFQPIKNDNLKSYKSYRDDSNPRVRDKYYAVKNLTVTLESGSTKNGAGLFDTATGTDLTDDPFVFENVRIDDANIDSSDSVADKPAGGIVGTARNVSFKNCRVETAMIKAKDKDAGGIAGSATSASFNICESINAEVVSAGGSAGGIAGSASGSFESCRVYWTATGDLGGDNNSMEYKVRGINAGGLAGSLSMEGSNKIENSFAATTVTGKTAGGLVGIVGGLSGVSVTLDIQKSYADCYLLGTGSGMLGGLIGMNGGSSTVSLTNVYSAGFISYNGSVNVGGLCASGTVGAENAYAAIYYEVKGGGVAVVSNPLASGVSAGKSTKCYFLRYSGITWSGNYAGTANDDSKGTMYADKDTMDLGSEFVSAPETHPYGLRQGSNIGTGVYPFKGLKDLDHYGDWWKESGSFAPKVRIINGDELQVEITCASTSSLTVELTYDGKTIIIPSTVPCIVTETKRTYTLDSLESGIRFKDFLKDAAGNATAVPTDMGKDFLVRAGVDWGSFISWSELARSNSLFAYREGTESFSSDSATAYIRNRRHLQNLDESWSGVKGKTAAVQIADITAGNHTPIVNAELLSYNGANYAINGMRVTAGNNGGAGLFGAGVFGRVGGAGTPFLFENVRITDIKVEVSGDVQAGGLAGMSGSGSPVTFAKCSVEGGSVTGGGSAGGLLGYATGDAVFTDCAVTNVDVTKTGTADEKGIGGLAGRILAKATLTGCAARSVDISNNLTDGDCGYRDSIGGLVGYANTASFSKCSVGDTTTVKGKDRKKNDADSAQAVFVGGMVGLIMNDGNVTDCQVDSLSAAGDGSRACVGGLAGYAGGVTFQNCYIGKDASVTVEGNSSNLASYKCGTGGLAGYAAGNTTLKQCYAVNVTAVGNQTADRLGGLVGMVSGSRLTLTGCGVGYYPKDGAEQKGTVKITGKGNGQAGGIAGCIEVTAVSGAVLSDCKAVGIEVASGESASDSVGTFGGMIGCITAVSTGSASGATLSRWTADGVTVTGHHKTSGTRAGGIIGLTESAITLKNCATTNNTRVTGVGGKIGGMVGAMAEDAILDSCTVDRGTTIQGNTTERYAVSHVGGMVGYATENITLRGCKASGISVEKNDLSDRAGVGGLLGYGEKIVTLEKNIAGTPCTVEGVTSVSGKGFRNYVGGMVGYAETPAFNQCVVGTSGTEKVSVTGTCNQPIGTSAEYRVIYVGGIAGHVGAYVAANGYTFKDCKVKNIAVEGIGDYSTSVIGRSFVGGILGYAKADSVFSGCVIGVEEGTDRLVSIVGSGTELKYGRTGTAGGVLGATNTSVTLRKCQVYNADIGHVEGTPQGRFHDAGGMAGYVGESDTTAMMENCIVKNSRIGGSLNAGGMVGRINSNAVVNSCEAINVQVESKDGSAGGMAGRAGLGGAEFQNCKVNSFSVSIGGRIGYPWADKLDYNIELDKNTGAGGIAGYVAKADNKITGHEAKKTDLNQCNVSNGTVENKNTDGSAGALVGCWEVGAVIDKTSNTTGSNVVVRGTQKQP